VIDLTLLVVYYTPTVTTNRGIKMATRMTATSKAAIQAADRVEIFTVEAGGSVSYCVKAWSADRLCLVHGGDGFAMLYPSIGAADRAVRRLRPDVSVSVSTDPV
jgi:hypothetical protein